jgi:hypothetical protein
MGVTTTPATGARGSIHIAQETTFGVAVEELTHLIEFTSESLSAQESELMSEAIRDTRGMSQLVRGNLDIQGDINFEQNASGLGMILRHALGDYIKVPKADGGDHGRVDQPLVDIKDETDTVVKRAIVFTADHSSAFPALNGKFARVFRNAVRKLELNDNTGTGFGYDASHGSSVTYALTTAAAGDYLRLEDVVGPSGTPVNPVVGTAGVLLFGPSRQQVTYFDSRIDAVTNKVEVRLSFGSPSVAANSYIMISPVLISDTTFGVTLSKGDWLYGYNATTYDGVFTHHLERGRYLPVGMTVEVHRDAAVFLYTGCKVNTLALTFDANSIVTGTASLIGKIEHSIATLVLDVLPGASVIYIDKRDAFPAAGYLTIGEETNIAYDDIEPFTLPDGREVFEVSITNLIPEESIERFHPRGQNVDSRTSRKAATVVSGVTSPLTSFETLVYIDGYFEEVLSANFTLNNNLSTDKFGLGSRFRLATVEGRAEIDGTLSMEFDDGKHYNKFLRGEKFSIELKCIAESDDSLIGTTGVPSQAYYFLPKCKYNGTTPQIGDTNIINHDMPFRAIVDTEYGDTDLVIILVNALNQDVQI